MKVTDFGDEYEFVPTSLLREALAHDLRLEARVVASKLVVDYKNGKKNVYLEFCDHKAADHAKKKLASLRKHLQ